MTKDELNEKLQNIEREKDLEARKVLKEYALSNAIYKVGDIIEDHLGRIKIESVSWSMNYGHRDSTAVYVGAQLKKDLTTFKSGEKRNVYQNNVTSCIAG